MIRKGRYVQCDECAEAGVEFTSKDAKTARKESTEHGWRRAGKFDYCPRCWQRRIAKVRERIANEQ